jgi:hypothetical protein
LIDVDGDGEVPLALLPLDDSSTTKILLLMFFAGLVGLELVSTACCWDDPEATRVGRKIHATHTHITEQMARVNVPD